MIAFIGGANWDVTLRCSRFPKRGECVGGSLLYENPGGGTLNAAAVSAALGIPTLLISRCGNDEHGRAIRDAATRHHSLRTFWTTDERTNTVYILLDGEEDAERTMICTSQGNNPPPPPPQALDEVGKAMLVDLVTRDDGYRAEYLKCARGRCCVDVKHLPVCLESRSRIEIVVGSQDNRETPQESLLRAAGTEVCVMTAGARGGAYWTPDAGWKPYQPLAAATVVDSCGAGDAFRAGLLVGLHRGMDVEGALDIARWCGAQAVAYQGSWCSKPLDYPR